MRGIGLAVLIAGVAAARGASGEGGRPALHEVKIAAFAYAPATITAAPGDTIVWRNADVVPHTATAADSSWDSGSLATGDTWRFVPRGRGEWPYRCALHPTMRGTIVVR